MNPKINNYDYFKMLKMDGIDGKFHQQKPIGLNQRVWMNLI